MPYCPSPDCRHFHRTGKHAEYRVGVDSCADCGQELVAGPPPASSLGSPAGWPKPLLQKLAVTVAVLLLVWMATYLPHPLLDPDAQQALRGHGLDTGPLALGIRPLLVSFILVELGALILPGTRQRRRQDPVLRNRLWLIAALLGVAFAWLQGFSLALTLEQMNGPYGWSTLGTDIVPNPGWAFRLSNMALVAIGTGALAVAARWLDRHGLGPGMAALLVLDLLRDAGHGLYQHGQEIFLGAIVPFHGMLALLALTVVLGAAHWLLGRRPAFCGTMPVALPSSGLEPMQLLLAPMGLLYAATAFTNGALDPIVYVFTPGTISWLVIACVGVVIGVPVYSTLFYWRRRRWWSGPERGHWLGLQAGTAALLIGLLLIEHLGLQIVPYLLMGGLVGWIGLAALLGDSWAEVQAWRRSPAGELQELAAHQDVADALEDLERRQREDPDGHYALVGLRYRSLCYFFGPWVPLRILGEPSAHSRVVEE